MEDDIRDAEKSLVLAEMTQSVLHADYNAVTMPDFTKLAAMQVTPCQDFITNVWPILNICLSPMVMGGYIDMPTLIALNGTCTIIHKNGIMRHWWNKELGQVGNALPGTDIDKLVQKLTNFPRLIHINNIKYVMVALGAAGARQVRQYLKKWDVNQWILYLGDLGIHITIDDDYSDYIKLWDEILLSYHLTTTKQSIRPPPLNISDLYSKLLEHNKEFLIVHMVMVARSHSKYNYEANSYLIMKHDSVELFRLMFDNNGSGFHIFSKDLLRNSAINIIQDIITNPQYYPYTFYQGFQLL